MMQQIEMMDKGLLKPGETMGSPFHTISGRNLQKVALGSATVNSRPILNIPTSGAFRLTDVRYDGNAPIKTVKMAASPANIKAQL